MSAQFISHLEINPSNATDLKVYVIESPEWIEEISNKMKDSGSYAMLAIMYRWDGKQKKLVETRDKNIIVCPEQTIQKFITSFPQFKQKTHNYDWTTFPKPKVEENETEDLHISGIPNDYSREEAIGYIRKELSIILNDEDYDVDFPLHQRSTGIIHGYGCIKFRNHVPVQLKYLCKILLHHKPLVSKRERKPFMVTAVWNVCGTNKPKYPRYRDEPLSIRPKPGTKVNVFKHTPQNVDLSKIGALPIIRVDKLGTVESTN